VAWANSFARGLSLCQIARLTSCPDARAQRRKRSFQSAVPHRYRSSHHIFLSAPATADAQGHFAFHVLAGTRGPLFTRDPAGKPFRPTDARAGDANLLLKTHPQRPE